MLRQRHTESNHLQNIKHFCEAAGVEAHAIATGLGPLLASGAVVKRGGFRVKSKFVEGIVRYGFTAGRQAWYAAETAPNRTAIIDDMGEVTYGQVREETEALGRYFLSKNIGAGKNIAVMARNSRVIMYPLIAKGYIGANICLLNPFSSPVQLHKSIKELDVHAILIDEEFADYLPADFSQAEVIIGYAEDLHNPKTPNPQWKTFQQTIEQAPSKKEVKLPFVAKRGTITIMSSGTSGTPKAVVNREPIFPTPIADLITLVPWRAEMMIQQTASMFHSWGWANINLIFAHRSTVVLRRVFDPVQAMEDAEHYNVNAIITSPIFIKEQLKVAQSGNYSTPNVEFIVSSGNAMHEDLIRGLQEHFGPVVCNFYGSTENSVVAIATKEDLVEEPALAGRPVAGVRVKILDDNGNVLPPNTPGRIYARSTLSMRRYANKRDKMVLKQGLLEIGDRGYLDDDGRLFVLGRADDMIIVGGENVYPRSVEEVLAPMPGIRDLFAMGVDDEETFKRMAVWVVRDDSPAGAELTKESIQEWIRSNLAEHSVPRDVTFMDELPRNPTGKVMPRMLPNT